MNFARLEKILALADSPHDGEALAALRNARSLLRQEGLGFADLGTAAVSLKTERKDGIAFDALASATEQALRAQIKALREQVVKLERQTPDVARETEQLRQQVASLGRSLGRSQAESEKWRVLARDMADQLWELGQMVEGKDKACSA